MLAKQLAVGRGFVLGRELISLENGSYFRVFAAMEYVPCFKD